MCFFCKQDQTVCWKHQVFIFIKSLVQEGTLVQEDALVQEDTLVQEDYEPPNAGSFESQLFLCFWLWLKFLVILDVRFGFSMSNFTI